MENHDRSAEYIAWFRKTYRPARSDRDLLHEEFERDFERLVYEITAKAFHDAQAPFVAELHAYRRNYIRRSGLSIIPPGVDLKNEK